MSVLKRRFEGVGWQGVMKHPGIIPLYMCMVAGVTLALFYSSRCLFTSPEVSLNRKKNPEPWNAYKNKQYKFMEINKYDYTQKHPAPEY